MQSVQIMKGKGNKLISSENLFSKLSIKEGGRHRDIMAKGQEVDSTFAPLTSSLESILRG